jgi:hypothetical protein
MSTQIQFRRDTAANWTSNSPILAQGEVGLETDTNSYKIGDGSTTWTALNYHQLAPEITTLLLDGQSSDPSAPAAGELTVYSKAIGGRMMLKQIGPSGLATSLQPFLGRNKVGYWNPPGNNTTQPGVFGYTALTTTGSTVTTRSVATVNLFQQMRRLGFVSAIAASSIATAYVAPLQITIGTGTSGLGGFYKVCRFGCSDAATLPGTPRQFVGVSALGAPTNVEPSTLTNTIGVGHGAADTNLKMYCGGSSAQTPVSLGSNFPINTLSADVYELVLFAPSSDSTHVYWEVTRLNTGNVATGTFTGTPGTTLPSTTQLLSYQWAWRTNGSSTTAKAGLDIMSDYIETDN